MEKIVAPFKGFINKSYPQGSCSQWFGENPALYGQPPHYLKGHNGIDYVAPYGTPMVAIKDGFICDVSTDPVTGYGYEIRLRTKSNEVWIYAHMSKVGVKLNQEVKAGDYVGDMGNTGFVVSSIDGNGFWVRGSNKHAGTHLHTAKRKVHDYVAGVDTAWHGSHRGVLYTIENMNNGYNGWLDVRADFDMIDTEVMTKEKLSELIRGKSIVEALKIVLKYFTITR